MESLFYMVVQEENFGGERRNWPRLVVQIGWA